MLGDAVGGQVEIEFVGANGRSFAAGAIGRIAAGRLYSGRL
jgi:hypothetical protein